VSASATVKGIVVRDLIRSVRQRSRILAGVARPFIWVLLVAAGFSSITTLQSGVPYHAFAYPGGIVMGALFGGTLTAISTVYDREFGMLRLMLASPSGTAALLAGRLISATLVGMLQGGVVLLTAPLVIGVSWPAAIAAIPILALAALASGALGLLIASRVSSVENFGGIINVVLFPLLFVSGALYPTAGMPGPLRTLAQMNPVTYMVDLMRRALGQPVEFGAATALGALLLSALLAFSLAALLFDPEQRFVRRVDRKHL
jgi:ABC-2 type transport system permease protein